MRFASRKNDLLVEHTLQVLQQLNRVLATATDAEAAARGFVISGIDTFLEPYAVGRERITGELDELRTLTADNPEQQKNFEALSAAVQDRVNVSEHLIALRRSQGFEPAAALVATGEGRAAMDRVRDAHLKMTLVENAIFEQRDYESRVKFIVSVWTQAGTTGAAAGMMVMLAFVLDRFANQRKRAAERVRLDKERFETTLRSIGDAVAVTDRDERVTFLESCGAGAHWLGRRCDWAPADRRLPYRQRRDPGDSRQSRLTDSRGESRPQAGEPHCSHRTGRDRIRHRRQRRAHFRPQSRHYRRRPRLRDVSEQRRVASLIDRQNTALIEASRAKDDFVAMLCHELRTPIGAVLGWSKMLADGVVPEHEQPHAVGVIIQNSSLQARLIDDLLDVTRLARGRVSLKNELIEDISAVVRTVIDTLLPGAHAREVTIEAALERSGPVPRGSGALAAGALEPAHERCEIQSGGRDSARRDDHDRLERHRDRHGRRHRHRAGDDRQGVRSFCAGRRSVARRRRAWAWARPRDCARPGDDARWHDSGRERRPRAWGDLHGDASVDEAGGKRDARCLFGILRRRCGRLTLLAVTRRRGDRTSR